MFGKNLETGQLLLFFCVDLEFTKSGASNCRQDPEMGVLTWKVAPVILLVVFSVVGQKNIKKNRKKTWVVTGLEIQTQNMLWKIREKLDFGQIPKWLAQVLAVTLLGGAFTVGAVMVLTISLEVGLVGFTFNVGSTTGGFEDEFIYVVEQHYIYNWQLYIYI